MVETKQKCTVTALAPSVTHANSIREIVSPMASPMRVGDAELGRFDPAATLIRIQLVMSITGIGRATVDELHACVISNTKGHLYQHGNDAPFSSGSFQFQR